MAAMKTMAAMKAKKAATKAKAAMAAKKAMKAMQAAKVKKTMKAAKAVKGMKAAKTKTDPPLKEPKAKDPPSPSQDGTEGDEDAAMKAMKASEGSQGKEDAAMMAMKASEGSKGEEDDIATQPDIPDTKPWVQRIQRVWVDEKGVFVGQPNQTWILKRVSGNKRELILSWYMANSGDIVFDKP